MRDIHKTAIIEKNVSIEDRVSIGAFSILKEGCVIGQGTKIGNSVEIGNHVIIGKDNMIHKGAFIGQIPQMKDLKIGNSLFPIEIGDKNRIYEYVTIHFGLERVTTIGHDNMIMGQCHIGHDVLLKNSICLANQTLIGGFCEIDDYAFISGHVSIHPYVRIGKNSMVGASLFIKKDIPPYSLIGRKFLSGVNKIGLKKLDFSYQSIDFIKCILKILFCKTLSFESKMRKVNKIKEFIKKKRSKGIEEIQKEKILEELILFMSKTKRGFVSFK